MLSTLGANLKNKERGHWFFNGWDEQRPKILCLLAVA
jgi:hypothetical protein